MKTVNLFILCTMMLLLGNVSLFAETNLGRSEKIEMKSQHYKGSIKSLPIPLNIEVYFCDDNSVMLKALDDQNGALEVSIVSENGAMVYQGMVNVQANSSVVLPLQNLASGSYTVSITDYDVLMEGEFIIQDIE